MLSQIKQNVTQKMQKIVDYYKDGLTKIRTGRANAGILDHIYIDYYGEKTKLTQIATIAVSDAKTLTVQAWDTKMTAAIEKAIREADLGLNPIASSSVLRIPMPVITEERRKELIKFIKVEAEDTKVLVRNVRRDANNELKTQLKDKLINEDEQKAAEKITQELTDHYIMIINNITIDKEKELLTI